MKLFVVICIFLMAGISSNSAKITPLKNNNLCKTVSLEADYYNGKEGETRVKKSNESPCQGNAQLEYPTKREVIDAPSLPWSQQPELEILENIPYEPNYFYGLNPVQRSFDWNAPWQRIDYQSNNLPAIRGPYSGIPYAYSPLFTTSPSAYLPPVVPAYARRTIPELHRETYRRTGRVTRSREEDDFMAELQHMAMMNNILPTMSIPFLRSSSYGPYRDSNGGASAVFPSRATGCALPLLFSCSPQITRGIVAKPLPPNYSQYEPPSYGYIQQEPASLKSDVSQMDVNSNSYESHENYHNGHDAPTMNAIDRALQPKHVANENHTISDKIHTDNVLPVANVTH